MTEMLTYFFIASDKADGGAILFGLGEDEKFYEIRKIPMPHPTWIELIGDRICAVLRDREGIESYAEFSAITGKNYTGMLPTMGKSVCHFTKDGDDVYCANYSDGSVMHFRNGVPNLVKHEVGKDGELGCDKERQERPHCHECTFSPDKKFVLVCDLGLDSVIVYDRDMNKVSVGKVPDGHGARHCIFDDAGETLYVINEMASSVSVFSWNGEEGKLGYRYTVNVRPEAHEGLSDAAEIVLSRDGKHMYATNRGTANTICHLTVGDKLEVVSQTDCRGNHPRGFGLVADGKYAVSCNTFSDNMVLFRVKDDGELEFVCSYDIPAPLSISEVK